jgi:hypothetical protein
MGVASISFAERCPTETPSAILRDDLSLLYAVTCAAQLGWPHGQAISVSLLPASLHAWLQYLSLALQVHGTCAHFL